MIDTAPRGNTLVIQPLPGIGDMIWHLSPIHAIAAAAPRGKVTLLTKPRSRAEDLLCADDAVGEVLWLERNPGRYDGVLGFMRLVAMLRRRSFGCVWLLHTSARYALAALLAGIPQRIGYGFGMQRLFLSHPVTLPAQHRHDHPILKAGLLVELCGLAGARDEPRLPVSPRALERVRQRFGHLPRPWLALGIGSSEPVKQWGRENYARLLGRLDRGQWPTVFVVGGSAERDMGAWVIDQARAQGREVQAALELPIDETAALLSCCHLFIGNDTGVLNMAAAVQVPALGLFGASQPLRHSRFIHCVTPDQEQPASAAMAAITVDKVVAATASLVQDGRAQSDVT
jgi:heptosyltransferase-2